MAFSFFRCSCAVILSASQLLMGAESSANSLLPGGLSPNLPAQPGALADADTIGLHIVVIEGEDGVNIIKKKTAVKPVVEVRDKNNLPIAGAIVTFSSPDSGPSLMFSNGSHTISAVTEANGRAVVYGSKPLDVGRFQVNVSATYQSQTATLNIPMTNVMTAAAIGTAGTAAGTGVVSTGAASGISATTIGIIAGVAAAAAIGLAVGLTRHSTPAATVTSTGGATVGAP